MRICATSFNIAKRLKNLWKKSFGWKDEIGSWKYLLTWKKLTYIIKNVFAQNWDKCYLYLFTLCFSGNSSLWLWLWIDAKYCQMTLQSARWHCSHAFIGNPWSNKRDANVEDSDCPVWILLLFSIGSIFDIKTLPVWLLRWRMAKLHSFILAKKLKIGAVQRIENLVSKYLVHK